jgi:hypothetical protein
MVKTAAQSRLLVLSLEADRLKEEPEVAQLSLIACCPAAPFLTAAHLISRMHWSQADALYQVVMAASRSSLMASSPAAASAGLFPAAGLSILKVRSPAAAPFEVAPAAAQMSLAACSSAAAF